MSDSPYDDAGQLKAPARQEREAPRPTQGQYLAMVRAALDIASANTLGLIATISACVIWFWAVYDPNPLRTYAAAGFSVSVLIPTIVLCWKRGQ